MTLNNVEGVLKNYTF